MEITDKLMEQGRRAAKLVAAIMQPRQRYFVYEEATAVVLLLTIAAYLDGQLPEYEEDIMLVIQNGSSGLRDATRNYLERVVPRLASEAGFQPSRRRRPST